MKIRPIGAEKFQEDGRTERQIWRSYSRFSQFCEPSFEMYI